MIERLRLMAVSVLCMAAMVLAVVWFVFAVVGSPRRAWRIAVGFDQIANAAFGGDEDETISARCWRYRADPWYSAAVQIINLMFFDAHHCERAYLSERAKRCSMQ